MAYGGLLENNWKEHPNGGDYRRWLGARGRSDVQRLVDGVLRPQIAPSTKSGEQEKPEKAPANEPESQEEKP